MPSVALPEDFYLEKQPKGSDQCFAAVAAAISRFFGFQHTTTAGIISEIKHKTNGVKGGNHNRILKSKKHTLNVTAWDSAEGGTQQDLIDNISVNCNLNNMMSGMIREVNNTAWKLKSGQLYRFQHAILITGIENNRITYMDPADRENSKTTKTVEEFLRGYLYINQLGEKASAKFDNPPSNVRVRLHKLYVHSLLQQ